MQGALNGAPYPRGSEATECLAQVVTGEVEFATGAFVVTIESVNLRPVASTEIDPVAPLAAGEVLMVVDAPVIAGGRLWYPVVAAAGEGWVAAANLSAEAV